MDSMTNRYGRVFGVRSVFLMGISLLVIVRGGASSNHGPVVVLQHERIYRSQLCLVVLPEK